MNVLQTSAENRLLPVGFLLDGRYHIKECLGTGGMGSVYLAADARSKVGAECAVKVLHPKLLHESTMADRFIREAELLGQVNHPNVVRAFSIGQEDDLAYFTMEYIPGTPLEQILKRGPFPTKLIPNFLIQIVEALAAIHSAGIIHRDLKPANILITRTFSVHLTDLGSARTYNSRLTTDEEVLGSPCYIAPELWLGKPPSPAADYYSLGVILYELAVGDVPFDGAWPGEVMRRHLDDEPIAPRARNPQTPIWLNDLIQELLIKSAELRCSSASLILECAKLHGDKHESSIPPREVQRPCNSDTQRPAFLKSPWVNTLRRATLRLAYFAGLSLCFYLMADYVVGSMIP